VCLAGKRNCGEAVEGSAGLARRARRSGEGGGVEQRDCRRALGGERCAARAAPKAGDGMGSAAVEGVGRAPVGRGAAVGTRRERFARRDSRARSRLGKKGSGAWGPGGGGWKTADRWGPKKINFHLFFQIFSLITENNSWLRK
jgi:hypothetical protein